MAKKEYACTTCGYIGQPKTGLGGSMGLELLLWLLGIALIFAVVPIIIAIIYSGWRLTTKFSNGCPKCNNHTMIPSDTPIGQKLINK